MSSLEKQPQWIRNWISDLERERDRIIREAKQLSTKCEKQSEEIQYLLDIVRNLCPDLYEKWNSGIQMKEILELSKKPN